MSSSLTEVVRYGLSARYGSWPTPRLWGDVIVTPYSAVNAPGHRYKGALLEVKDIRRLREWARTAQRRRISVRFQTTAVEHPNYPERMWHPSNVKRRQWRQVQRLGLAPQNFAWLQDHEHTSVRLTANNPHRGWVFVVFNRREPIAWFAPLIESV